jgi:hypothetical protein
MSVRFILLPLPLRTISTDVILFPYMNTKYAIVTLIHPFLMPSPSHWYSSLENMFYLPSFIFLKCILIVQGGFTLAFQTCIYHAVIRLNPLHYLLFLYYHAPLLFRSLQCIMFYYLHIQIESFNIFHSLTLSFPLLPPVVTSDRPTNTVLFTLSLCVCVCVCVCMCVRSCMYLCVHIT